MKATLLILSVSTAWFLADRSNNLLADDLIKKNSSERSENNAPAQSTAETNGGSANAEPPLYGGRDFDTWVHLLNVDLDDATRWQAVKAIGILGLKGRKADALTVLSPLVHSQDSSLAQSSHAALAVLGDEGVNQLVTALRDETYPFRESIIQSLGKAGPNATSSVECLLEIAASSEVELRRRAFESLLAIGTPANPIAIAIEKEIERNDDPHAATTIIFSLGDSPLDYAVKERLLIKWMKSEDRKTAHAAATTMAKIGKDNDWVREALRSSIRAYVANPNTDGACPNVGAKGANVELLLPLLVAVAEEQDLNDPKVRDGTFMRLFVDQMGQLGKQGRPAVPTLVKILVARKEPRMTQVDFNIVQSLWQMGAGARDALPILEKIRQDVLERKIDQTDAHGQRDREFQLQTLNKTIERIKASTNAPLERQ